MGDWRSKNQVVYNNVDFVMDGDIDIHMNINSVIYYPYREALIRNMVFILDRDSNTGKSIENGILKSIKIMPDNHCIFGLVGRHNEEPLIYIQISDSHIIFGTDIRVEHPC